MRCSRTVPLALALATCALALAGCTPDATTTSTSEPAPTPEPTHAIVYIAEEWMIPSPPESGGTIPSQHGVDWRISAIDLASGEERVLAAEVSGTIEPRRMPVLSPDGTQLLYGVPEPNEDALPSRYFGSPGSMRLYRLDLGTEEALEVCQQLVRSFGWDGDDIIATAWRDVIVVEDPPSTSYTSPPPNAVLRISGSEATTIVAQADVRPERTDDGALTDQLDYLGSDDGELYFEERSDGTGGLTVDRSEPRRIWRLRSGETSITPAITLQSGDQWRYPGSPDAFEDMAPGTDDAASLALGLFPTMVEHLSTQAVSGMYRADVVARELNVRTASDMEVVSSFETTTTEPLPGQFVWPLYSPDLTRWLDQRRLAPPLVTEEGTWLCETDAASQETTALALVNRSSAISDILGYVGSELNVLYASGDGRYGPAPVPRTLSLWERATGESRQLIELAATHRYATIRVELVGGAALE